MQKEILVPDYIFESSWEVCNKMGGIYTVLSTKADTLRKLYDDRILFIGPDLSGVRPQPDFNESKTLFKSWRLQAAKNGLNVRVGRWGVPGSPIAILVQYKPFFKQRDRIYTDVWNWFGVDSLPGYGDYDESCMFAWACGEAINSFIQFQQLKQTGIIAHFNEWMMGMGLLYCRHFLPGVGTVFTTHATSIGRSICGNNLPLYDFLSDYHGDQMARNLNMVAKHSLEKIAAAQADCFTTVSDITATECACLLDKQPDVVTPNGFEPLFVKQGAEAVEARKKSRTKLLSIAKAVTGTELSEETMFVGLSGRYEFRNKGIDVFIDALYQLKNQRSLQHDVVGVVMVPADVAAPRQEVVDRLAKPETNTGFPIYEPFLTHWLNHIESDKVLNMIHYRGFRNTADEKVKLIFIPCYLNGQDGIVNLPYYELLYGFDLTVFPSYYEPWGYTPLESLAFSVPTITTNLAGFGAWALKNGDKQGISDGVAVIHRSDHNYADVMKEIALVLLEYSQFSQAKCQMIGEQALAMSQKATWSTFIKYYQQAFSIALSESAQRG